MKQKVVNTGNWLLERSVGKDGGSPQLFFQLRGDDGQECTLRPEGDKSLVSSSQSSLVYIVSSRQPRAT